MNLEEFAKFFIEGMGDHHLVLSTGERKELLGDHSSSIFGIYNLTRSTGCSAEEAKLYGKIYRMALDREHYRQNPHLDYFPDRGR